MDPIHYSPVFAGLTPDEIDRLLDGHTQEKPEAFELEEALHRADFKIEEIV